jgi:type VII secretion integral membrane protein EccD
MTTETPRAPSRPIPPAPENARLSFLGNHTQVDVPLPLDVPIASVIPLVVQLTRTRNGAAAADSSGDDSSAGPDQHAVWALSRLDDGEPLAPASTLREAGVTDGELLRLTATPARTELMLYDDVVDATAHFHKAGHAAWDANAARWMAFAGTYLSVAVWAYFLLAQPFTRDRLPLVGVAVLVSLALAGAAALAQRSYARADVAAALGWAAVLIASTAAWAALHGLGSYGPPAGCLVAVAACAVLHRAVGSGHWGYLAVGVVYAFIGVALLARAAVVRTDIAGVGLALLSILCVPAVPALAARFTRPLRRRRRARTVDAEPPNGVVSGAPEDVWARLRSVTATRAALYTGLSVSAAAAVLLVLTTQHPLRWSGLLFAWGCAAVVGIQSRRPRTLLERAGLATPAALLLLASCFLAQQGRQPMPLVAFLVLLASLLVCVGAAITARPQQPPAWLETTWAYLAYVATAALMPLALWVIDAYQRLGAA